MSERLSPEAEREIRSLAEAGSYATARDARLLLAEIDSLREEVGARWTDLRDLAKALGYKRADAPDFGEVDTVPLWKWAQALAEVVEHAARARRAERTLRRVVKALGDPTTETPARYPTRDELLAEGPEIAALMRPTVGGGR